MKVIQRSCDHMPVTVQFKIPAFQMSSSNTKRKLEDPEENFLSKKRISLKIDSKSLDDTPNSDSGVSRVQLEEEQVWIVQWYNPIVL